MRAIAADCSALALEDALLLLYALTTAEAVIVAEPPPVEDIWLADTCCSTDATDAAEPTPNGPPPPPLPPIPLLPLLLPLVADGNAALCPTPGTRPYAAASAAYAYGSPGTGGY
ncbi:hypothetical protein T4D_6674 [Trichinella pseudospiralis]|uniref:Uncharacterized protein n=1 Tax=Trichinella pseudospiralis TaxID=6337 RepID=A0A0V1F9R2_TRIPS|nr:hypothetical protein T4D_6674 [Trichinella pseudospiralis]